MEPVLMRPEIDVEALAEHSGDYGADASPGAEPGLERGVLVRGRLLMTPPFAIPLVSS